MTTSRKITVALLALLALMLIIGIRQFTSEPYPAFPAIQHLSFDNSEHEVLARSWRTHDELYLEELRVEFDLDALIQECSTDYERVRAITDWVHNLWKHDGNNQPAQDDPLFILREVAKGQRFRCVEYGIVISGCLQALGIEARTLGLKTQDVETRPSGAGHVGTEAFLPDLRKWVIIDGQWNAIPELAGLPLNAVELQAALVSDDPDLSFPGMEAELVASYKKWIAPYLYYFDVWTGGQRIMLGPIGAKQPTVFQRNWPLRVSVYTHSVPVFYAPPN